MEPQEKSASGTGALVNLSLSNTTTTAAEYQSELHKAAAGYAQRGLAVFPLSPKTKMPLKGSKGFKEATTNLDQIHQWWALTPNANIGIATGGISGIFVLDIDVDDEKDGEASLRALETEYCQLPHSVEQITGGGGRQIIFEQSADITTSTNAGQLGEGLDIRGDGGYIVVPPSIHPNGKRYEWSVDSANIFASIPHWLLELTTKPKEGEAYKSPQEWCEIAQGVTKGQRNATLAQIAGKLFRHLPAHMAAELCAAWNEYRCQPPLDRREFQTVIRSIASRELKRKGGV